MGTLFMAGNLILGGILGGIIGIDYDMNSGALFELRPNPIVVSLDPLPVDQPEPAVETEAPLSSN